MSTPPIRLPVTRLPFVRERADGRVGYWVLPAQTPDVDLRMQGRTYAAWFLIYREANGVEAAVELLDRIELEMPSRYPALDRAFLLEVSRPRSSTNAA